MPDVPQWFKLKNNAHLTTDVKSSNEDQATKAPLLGVKTLNQVKVVMRLWKHREYKNILWFASIECKARKLTEIRVKERSKNLEQNAGSPTFSRSSWQQTEGAILRLLAGWPDPSPKCHCCGAQCCELWLCYHTCVCNQELKWKECATAWFTGENFCPVVERRKKLCIVLKERRLEEKKK